MSKKFYLPSGITSYLRRLQIEYGLSENQFLLQIVSSSRAIVREMTSVDNWDFNTTASGHDVLLFLPDSIFEKIKLVNQEKYCQKLCEDLNRCKDIDGEFFNQVFFKCENENDEEYQQAVSLSDPPQIDPEMLDVWKFGHIRLFISHSAKHKKEVRDLADALEDYGISAFVAHDRIKPMEKWQSEILKGLETMEIMLAFVTDDFHKSVWTNQEIGFALGCNVPILSLKLEETDPKGFIGSEQALNGNLENPAASVPKIYELLWEKLANKNRLQSALITAFIESPKWDKTRIWFDYLDKFVDSLSQEEVASIIDGFEKNSQLNNCYYLTDYNNYMINFLEKTTGRKYIIKRRKIISCESED